MKLETLFPVQKNVIPVILNTCKNQSFYPNDLCILAPTGSGKTLTYVLPIINNLKNRIVPCCKVIVLLPVSDLAEQVYNVFKEQLANISQNDSNLNLIKNKEEQDTEISSNFSDNKLKIILLSNKNPFNKEQSQLVSRENGNKCLIDIVVATPGRLVDHIQKTSGFCLKNLNYLVLDECDRIMDQIKQNWLQILSQAIFGNENDLSNQLHKQVDANESNNSRQIVNSDNLNVYNLMLNKSKLMPFQKLLLSATLTRNPEKLEQMNLFQPIYFTVGAEKLNKIKSTENKQETVDKTEKVEEEQESSTNKEIKMINDLLATKKQLDAGLTEINVPSELNEIFIQVVLQQKPLIALYFIKLLGYKRLLCFVKSKESAKRLNKLFQLNGIKSMEYSSALHSNRRKKIQTKFETNEIDVLVCSDVMARGMDLANVDYVLLYDAPMHLSSYIHKVGRTARAGKTGTAITFLEHKEVYYFKKMMLQITTPLNETSEEKTTDAKKPHKVKEIKIQKSKLKPLMEDYRNSLAKLKEALEIKKPKKSEENKGNENGDDKDSNEKNGNSKKRRHKQITNTKYLKRIKNK